MLKLLKYDLKHMFKFWWIAALISMGLASMIGTCIRLQSSGKEFDYSIEVITRMIMMLAYLGIAALCIVSIVFVVIRLYKNFFTDEGYLTFTLPVSKGKLLNSKLIAGMMVMVACVSVLFIDILIAIAIAYYEEFFLLNNWLDFFDAIKMLIDEIGVYFFIYLVEFLILGVLYLFNALLFLYNCLTFASIITKKAKIFAGIGIYYGANSIVSFIQQILLIFGFSSLFIWLSTLPTNYLEWYIALLLLTGILFLGMISSILYYFEYWMIDRKLNLE